MYAHVNFVRNEQPRPELGEEALQLHKELLPKRQQQHAGYQGTLLLVDLVKGLAFDIDLYESLAQLQAVYQQGHYQGEQAQYEHLISEAPAQEVYEVAVHEIELGSTPAYAAVHLVHLPPDKLDEGMTIFGDSVVPELGQVKGFKGTLLLVNRQTGKSLAIGVYETEDEVKAVEHNGQYRRQIAKFTHLFSAPPGREVYEVAYYGLRKDHPLSAQDNARLIQILIDAFNAKDVDRYAAMSTDDFEVLDVPSGMTLKGPDGFRQFVQSWMTAFPDSQVQATSLFTTQDQGHLEYLARGTNTGPFPYASGQIPPSGRRVEFRVSAGLQFREGKVASAHYYYDLLSVLQQLGLVPTKDGRLVPIS